LSVRPCHPCGPSGPDHRPQCSLATADQRALCRDHNCAGHPVGRSAARAAERAGLSGDKLSSNQMTKPNQTGETKMKRILTTTIAALCLAGAGQSADLKIGFIMPSPVADVGWAHQL